VTSPIGMTRRVALLSIPALASLATFGTARAQSDRVLKLGAICTVTGPNASIGREGLAGLEYSVKALNAAGGVKIGPDTYTLALVNIDDESKPERAVAAAEQLIGSEHVPVIFTPPASTATLAMLPTIEKNKVVAMSFVASAPAVTGKEFDYSFRSTLSSLDNVNPSIDFLVKNQGVKTIAYVGRNDDWGRSAAKALIARAEQLGAKVVVGEYFDTKTTDFFGLLTKVRGAEPDAVVVTFVEDGIPFLKQYRELRMKPTLLSLAVIWSSPVFLNAAGKTAEGVYIATGPRTAGTTAVEEFAATFQKSAGHAPLPYEITGYDSMTVVLAAMKKAGSIDPTATRDALRSLDFQGVLQDYAFNGTNQSSVDININKVTDGHVVPLVSIRS
jgi:branched-chain amino acid transport system substrate-binding protein